MTSQMLPATGILLIIPSSTIFFFSAIPLNRFDLTRRRRLRLRVNDLEPSVSAGPLARRRAAGKVRLPPAILHGNPFQPIRPCPSPESCRHYRSSKDDGPP